MSRSDIHQQPTSAEPNQARGPQHRRRIRGLQLALILVVAVTAWQGPRHWRQFCLAKVRLACAESRQIEANNWLSRLQWMGVETAEALLAEARISRRQGDLERARTLLQRPSPGKWREELQREQWLILAQTGDLADSEEPLLKVLQAEKDVPDVLDALVQGYLRSGQYSKAEASLNTWRDISPKDSRPFVLRGIWFLQLSDWTNAADVLREALRRSPQDHDAELLLAEALLGDKRADEAVQIFRRCLRVWPERESVAVGLSKALLVNGQADEAAEIVQPYFDRNPESLEVGQVLGEALLNSNRVDKAVEILRLAVQRTPQNLEIRQSLGTALRLAGNAVEAETHLHFVRDANHDLQEIQRLRTHILHADKSHDDKLKLAALLMKYDRIPEAIIWLRSLLAEQPRHGAGQRMLADAIRRDGVRSARRPGKPIEASILPGKSEVVPSVASVTTSRQASDWQMLDVATQVGIDFTFRNGREAGHATVVETLGGGAAWLDIDQDGKLDLFLPGGGNFDPQRRLIGHPPGLFRQISPEHFERISVIANLGDAPFYSHGAAVADLDQDGFSDLLVTGFGGLLLFRNQGDGTFRESAQEAGLIDEHWSTGAAWGDLNGDGDLDLYIAHYLRWSWKEHHTCPGPTATQPEVCSPKEFEPDQHFLFLGRGDGTFREAASELGLRGRGKGLGVVLGDVDLDGDLDIYVGNDTTENFLYANNGHGHFDEVGQLSGVDVDDHGVMNGSMGVDLGDFDNDGRPDIWVTNYLWESFAMYRNLGQLQFQHRSQTLGIAAIGGLHVGWGTGFADLDRDGDEDLIATTGHVLFHSPPDRQVPVFLRNDQGRRFMRVEFPAATYGGQPHHGRGLALADYDNDGDLDFAVSHNNDRASLIRNDIVSTGSWLRVRLIGRASNRDAIGARLTLHTSVGSQLRFVKGGGSYLSHSDRCPFWGIPGGASITQLEILWPTGGRQVVESPPQNQTLTVIEP